MNEETVTIRYNVYVEKQVYVNQTDDDVTAEEKINAEMWTKKEEYMDAKPLQFSEPTIIDRGF